MRALLPILTVLAVIVALWYAATVWMNARRVRDQAARAGETVTFAQIVPETMNLERPVLPAPHQVVAELWKGVAGQAVTSKRSLVYHAWVTLSATLLGFGIGTAMGILLAIGIVHNRAMDLSVMPGASRPKPKILPICPRMMCSEIPFRKPTRIGRDRKSASAPRRRKLAPIQKSPARKARVMDRDR